MTWPEWLTWDRVLSWAIGIAGFAAFVAREHIKRWMDHRWAAKKQRQDERRETDKALFRRFLRELPYEGSIRFIDKFNMAGWSFQHQDMAQLDDFVYTWRGPEHRFLDKAIEAKRKVLYDLIDEYLTYVAINTFCCKGNVEWVSVPPEWEETQPKRFRKVVGTLHSMAGRIVQAHRELVEFGKSRLNC